jgi:hypothetical protein
VFAGLINQAKGALAGLVLKYVARASVAIPFVFALGFALAALSMMLVQRFGYVTGYWTMAAGLAVIGTIAALIVSMKEHEEEVAEEKAEHVQTAGARTSPTTQALIQAPLPLLGAIFSTPRGVTSALKLTRSLGRNLPLVVFIAMMGGLFWSREPLREE